MDELIKRIIIFFLSGLLLEWICSTKNSKDNSIDRVVFNFTWKYRIYMLFCTMIFGLILYSEVFIEGFSFEEIMNKNLDSILELILIICMSILTIGSLIIFFISFNKKIVYENKTFYVRNTFLKKSEFYLSEVKEVKESNLEGMVITFNDLRKLTIEKYLNNYSKIYTILENNKINYK